MKILLMAFLVFSWSALQAQKPVGIFDNHTDIGNPKKAGSSQYDPATQTYTMTGAGYNIWFNRDEFQFLYKRLAGDFILTADFEFSRAAGDQHKKIGWMVRELIDEQSANMNACVHGDKLVVLQWRPLRGAFMRDPQDELFYPKKNCQTIQLERSGKKFIMRVAAPGEPLQLVGVREMTDMRDSVFAGLYICSHNPEVTEEARIWNVRIDKPVGNEYSANPQIKPQPSNDVLGSRLEILNVSDGKRKVIHESAGRFESPGWMPDGKKIRFNENGSVYTIPVEGGAPEKLNSSNASTPEYSPDKKYIYYNDNQTGTTQIWRMKPGGSEKEQLTFDEYHNWFPHISPDGKWMVFISYPSNIEPSSHPRYKQVMLRLMPLTKPGAPKIIAHLYGGQGTMDAPCWSPDSKSIVFVSNSSKQIN